VTGAEAQYTLAEVRFKQQQYDEAIKEAFKVNSAYSAYELWQGKAFLLLADVYTAQGDTYQARATLNSIIDNKFPVADIVAGARERLNALPASDDAPAAAPATPAKTVPAKSATPAKTTPAAPRTTTPAAPKAPARTPATKPSTRP
jgi:tetratricopeptide (TPR) repeat protein